ncbi:PAS domain-containing sensor histidine kinase [Pelagibacterium montanilacus]|uniref:PAS domain-containing sensor histidine kinase n=1 Tax=Pelagibacterium montanilacus TaxID=2185280 RepID=UPI0013DE82F5|nr:PAS domain-containing sensor histidine kinase [Pelagibacterium montanilacus]
MRSFLDRIPGAGALAAHVRSQADLAWVSGVLTTLALAGLVYPFALAAMVTGSYVPLVGASLGLAGSALALMALAQGRTGAAVLVHAAMLAGIGTMLVLAGPLAMAFGVGVLALAALEAGALARTLVSGAARTAQGPESLIEALPDPVVRFDPAGHPVFVSARTAAILGCRHFELDHGGLLARVHVLDRPAYMAAISEATHGRIGRTVEMRMRRDAEAPGESAQYLWMEMALEPIEADAGATKGPVGAVALLRDISARKRMEAETRAGRAEAEKASLAKSRFLATIGHELRTPLNAIVGFSDLMTAGIGGELNPTHSEYAGHIKQSGYHLLDVVNMLLDMSRLEAGRFELQCEAFDPEKIAAPCMQLVEQAAADRAIRLVRAVPTTLPRVLADERACRQILINLLSNAVKFSHDGGTVSLAMKRQGAMLNVSVTDTGVGMEPETIGRIGEPFLQEQTGLARRFEGTGLGLSIVKALVELHDGQLHVMSRPGEGTVVTVLLPLEGPERARPRPSAEITELRPARTASDEEKWQQDERKSAAG